VVLVLEEESLRDASESESKNVARWSRLPRERVSSAQTALMRREGSKKERRCRAVGD